MKKILVVIVLLIAAGVGLFCVYSDYVSSEMLDMEWDALQWHPVTDPSDNRSRVDLGNVLSLCFDDYECTTDYGDKTVTVSAWNDTDDIEFEIILSKTSDGYYPDTLGRCTQNGMKISNAQMLDILVVYCEQADQVMAGLWG